MSLGRRVPMKKISPNPSFAKRGTRSFLSPFEKGGPRGIFFAHGAKVEIDGSDDSERAWNYKN